MKIVEPYIEVEPIDGIKIMKNIEKACRTCYRSEGNITDDSYKKLLNNCITRGHESVLEHEKVTVRMYADLGVYKDITRHRIASFSIESTRYCNYGKDKFDNEIKFIKPCNIDEGTKLYDNWYNACKCVEDNYLEMSKLGATPDQMRMILPHSIAAEIVMTANIREWKHVLELRTTSHVHPAIRQVLIPLLLYFKKEMPEIFGEIPYDEDFPKEKYAELRKLQD